MSKCTETGKGPYQKLWKFIKIAGHETKLRSAGKLTIIDNSSNVNMTHCVSVGQMEQDELFVVDAEGRKKSSATTKPANISMKMAREKKRDDQNNCIKIDGQSILLSKTTL